MILKHNNKEYRLIDLNTEFTLRQQSIAKQFLTGVISIIQANPELLDLTGELNGLANKKDKNKAEQQKIKQINIRFGEIMMQISNSLNLELEILALLFIPKSDKIFIKEKYDDRVKEFESLVWDDKFDEVIKDFFTLKIASLMKSFLTSLTTLGNLKSIL